MESIWKSDWISTARYGMENLSQMVRALSVYIQYQYISCVRMSLCACTDNIRTFMRIPDINPVESIVFCEKA